MRPLCFYFFLSLIVKNLPFAFTQDSTNYCGSSIPKDETSCDIYTNSTSYCCYLTKYLNGLYINMCYMINKKEYLHMDNQITLNGYTFQIDCGNHIGTTCGPITAPKSYKDCGMYSLTSNSCCYINFLNETSCVWLGNSNIGQMTYHGLEITCDNKFVIWSKAYLIILIAMTIYLLE